MQRNRKIWSILKKKMTENVPKETQTLNLLDKDFK